MIFINFKLIFCFNYQNLVNQNKKHNFTLLASNFNIQNLDNLFDFFFKLIYFIINVSKSLSFEEKTKFSLVKSQFFMGKPIL